MQAEFLAVVCAASVASAAPPPASPAPTNAVVLRVGGDVERPLALSSEDFAKLPRRGVEARDHEGRTVHFEGVSLSDVLAAAGAPQGAKLRGPRLAQYLLVSARDGYRVVFALTELDPSFTDAVVLVADRRDGQPLDKDEGPLRLVVPHEKRQARWLRQLESLTVQAVP